MSDKITPMVEPCAAGGSPSVAADAAHASGTTERYRPEAMGEDPRLDRLIRVVADLFDVPLAAVSLFDRDYQWLTARFGLPEVDKLPRSGSFCRWVMETAETVVVPDLSQDDRFRDNAVVARPGGVRFYAGVPLVHEGHPEGVLCIADHEPWRDFTPEQRSRLERLAGVASDLLESHRAMLDRDAATAFTSNTTMPLLTTDAQGLITYANVACERMLAYPLGGLVGRNVSAIVPDRFRGPHVAGMASLAAGNAPRLAGKTVEVSALRYDGSEIAIELTLTTWHSRDGLGIGAMLRDISERRRRDARLLRLAHHDAQTGLPNRVRLVEEIETTLVGNGTAAALVLRIDGLRSINESFGHAVGDAVIEALSLRLRIRLPSETMLARVMGDQFALLMPGTADLETVETCAADLLAACAEPIAVNGHLLHVQGMIGAAFAPRDGADAEEVLASADLALHHASRGGEASCRMFEPSMRSAAAARRTLQDRLRLALRDGELELHYQPQVDLRTGRICGTEALIRWRHPEKGLLPPAEFLDAIETSALALPVGDWTLDEACRQNAAWRAAGLPPVRTAVNLFAVQLRAGNFAETVEAALARHGLPPAALELEVTERIALQNDAAMVSPLRHLQALGVGVAFDDFGTGFAALSTLKQFPLTKLKIDRSFVRDLLTDPHDAAIVKAILDMGAGLALSTIAEGIETAEHEAALLAIGCCYGQGYRYGRALEADGFAARLAADARAEAA